MYRMVMEDMPFLRDDFGELKKNTLSGYVPYFILAEGQKLKKKINDP